VKRLFLNRHYYTGGVQCRNLHTDELLLLTFISALSAAGSQEANMRCYCIYRGWLYIVDTAVGLAKYACEVVLSERVRGLHSFPRAVSAAMIRRVGPCDVRLRDGVGRLAASPKRACRSARVGSPV